MTPRPPSTRGGATPRPVVRGPQTSASGTTSNLTQEEDDRATRVFNKVNKSGFGEVDFVDFRTMCELLDLPIDAAVEKQWLAGRSEATGINLEEFKQIYGRILAAQTPAVRKVIGTGRLNGLELRGTEVTMRTAFNRYAMDGSLAKEDLPEVFQFLKFPDHHGDLFDRFVTEWLTVEGKDDDGTVNFHEFVNGYNLLVDFCERQRELSGC